VGAPPPENDDSRLGPAKQRLVPKPRRGSLLERAASRQALGRLAWPIRGLPGLGGGASPPRRISTEQGLAEIGRVFTAKPCLMIDRRSPGSRFSRASRRETDRERSVLIEQLKEIGRPHSTNSPTLAVRQRLAGPRPSSKRGSRPTPPAKAAAKRVRICSRRHEFTARNFEEIQRTIRYACEAPGRGSTPPRGLGHGALQNAASR